MECRTSFNPLSALIAIVLRYFGFHILPGTTHSLTDEEIGTGKVTFDHTGLGRLTQHIDGNAGNEEDSRLAYLKRKRGRYIVVLVTVEALLRLGVAWPARSTCDCCCTRCGRSTWSRFVCMSWQSMTKAPHQ